MDQDFFPAPIEPAGLPAGLRSEDYLSNDGRWLEAKETRSSWAGSVPSVAGTLRAEAETAVKDREYRSSLLDRLSSLTPKEKRALKLRVGLPVPPTQHPLRSEYRNEFEGHAPHAPPPEPARPSSEYQVAFRWNEPLRRSVGVETAPAPRHTAPAPPPARRSPSPPAPAPSSEYRVAYKWNRPLQRSVGVETAQPDEPLQPAQPAHPSHPTRPRRRNSEYRAQYKWPQQPDDATFAATSTTASTAAAGVTGATHPGDYPLPRPASAPPRPHSQLDETMEPTAAELATIFTPVSEYDDKYRWPFLRRTAAPRMRSEGTEVVEQDLPPAEVVERSVPIQPPLPLSEYDDKFRWWDLHRDLHRDLHHADGPASSRPHPADDRDHGDEDDELEANLARAAERRRAADRRRLAFADDDGNGGEEEADAGEEEDDEGVEDDLPPPPHRHHHRRHHRHHHRGEMDRAGGGKYNARDDDDDDDDDDDGGRGGAGPSPRASGVQIEASRRLHQNRRDDRHDDDWRRLPAARPVVEPLVPAVPPKPADEPLPPRPALVQAWTSEYDGEYRDWSGPSSAARHRRRRPVDDRDVEFRDVGVEAALHWDGRQDEFVGEVADNFDPPPSPPPPAARPSREAWLTELADRNARAEFYASRDHRDTLAQQLHNTSHRQAQLLARAQAKADQRKRHHDDVLLTTSSGGGGAGSDDGSVGPRPVAKPPLRTVLPAYQKMPSVLGAKRKAAARQARAEAAAATAAPPPTRVVDQGAGAADAAERQAAEAEIQREVNYYLNRGAESRRRMEQQQQERERARNAVTVQAWGRPAAGEQEDEGLGRSERRPAPAAHHDPYEDHVCRHHFEHSGHHHHHHRRHDRSDGHHHRHHHRHARHAPHPLPSEHDHHRRLHGEQRTAVGAAAPAAAPRRHRDDDDWTDISNLERVSVTPMRVAPATYDLARATLERARGRQVEW